MTGTDGPVVSVPEHPCAEPRRSVDTHCGEARRLETIADEVAARAAETRREQLAAEARAEHSRQQLDPGGRARAKVQARETYQHAARAARSPEEMQRAVGRWLNEIDRLNRATRAAAARIREERQRANDLRAASDALELDAYARRIAADTARQACEEARGSLARCEEREGGVPAVTTPQAGSETERVRGLAPRSMIVRLLHGDRDALQELAAALSWETGDEANAYQLLITDLTEAILDNALREGVLEFPAGHEFWSQMPRDEARRVVLALAGLGFRMDGRGGWADGRVPQSRDLATAVATAGRDPRRLRNWPGPAELQDLYAGVGIAPEEYLRKNAPDLDLEDVLRVLGNDARALGQLWDNWGRIRPLLTAVAA